MYPIKSIKLGPEVIEEMRDSWLDHDNDQKEESFHGYVLDATIEAFIKTIVFTFLDDPGNYNPDLVTKKFIGNLEKGELLQEFKLFYNKSLLGQIHISFLGKAVEGKFTPVEEFAS